MDNGLTEGKLIMIEAKSVIIDENKNAQNKSIEIKIANTKMQNLITNMVFEMENCKPEEWALIKCAGNCINVNFSNTIENKTENQILPQICLDSIEKSFNFIFLCNKPTKKPNPILGEAFMNRKNFLNVPKTNNKCMADYLEVKGNLEYPIKANLLEFAYKYSTIEPIYEKVTETYFLRTNKYVILHLLWLGKMDDENSDNKIIIEFNCDKCFGEKEENEDYFVFLKLELNFEGMMLTARTNDIVTKKWPHRIGFVKNSSAKIVQKNSFWLKIGETYADNKKENFAYKIYQNGANIMEIKSSNGTYDAGPPFRSIDVYIIKGNIALFNDPNVFPYRFSFKDTVTIKWRIMENAEFIEFFVAKGENVRFLGTWVQDDEFDNKDDDTVYLHIRADKAVKNGKICISTALIKNKNCPQKDESPIELLNPNEFKLDNLHELKITFKNDIATIQFDNNNPIEKQGKNFLDAKEFVINGDMIIIDAPTQIEEF